MGSTKKIVAGARPVAVGSQRPGCFVHDLVNWYHLVMLHRPNRRPVHYLELCVQAPIRAIVRTRFDGPAPCQMHRTRTHIYNTTYLHNRLEGQAVLLTAGVAVMIA